MNQKPAEAMVEVVRLVKAGRSCAATFERRGTRFDVVIAPGLYGDVLALSNHHTCMSLPDYWQRGMDAGYIGEKLKLGAVDAESVRLFLALVATRA